MKVKMPFDQAMPIARKYRDWLAPYCEPDYCVIAGSLRRKKSTVGDIEIVAIPRGIAPDMFGQPVLYEAATNKAIAEMIAAGAEVVKDGERYKQLALPEGIGLDLFLVIPPAQWGVKLLLGTGPVEFNAWVVTHRDQGGAMPNDCEMRQAAIWRDEKIIPVPTEADFLKLLGLPADLAPQDRRPGLPIKF